MELITIDDQLTSNNFNFWSSCNTMIDNTKLIKLDELDESLLHFGDIKVEKYSGLLGASRHITYNTKQYLAVKINRVKARWVGPTHLQICDDSPNFIRFLYKLQNCIANNVDVMELYLHSLDQGLVNKIVGITTNFNLNHPNGPFTAGDPEALRLYNL